MRNSSINVIHNSNVHRDSGPEWLSMQSTESVRHLHRSMPNYKETPLVSLKGLAHALGVHSIYVKDESKRFGLNAFKGLGGVYAICRIACEELGLDISKTSFSELQEEKYIQKLSGITFVTATDGNHGKGIAWAAAQLGCKAHVYMPRGSSEHRANAIREAGATEVVITELGYDDAVRYAKDMSIKYGWKLVQDTSWPGYENIPCWIIQGYTTMVYEAIMQMCKLHQTPTHVFLQAGVGAMAGSVTGFLANYYGNERPNITIVEPVEVACIFESAQHKDGRPYPATGSGKTIMAGLNCGEPCTITWPILRDYADHYVACPDYVAARGMRLLAAPYAGDNQIVSGESGAVTLGALSMILDPCSEGSLRQQFGLNEDSVVLLINTEGDTDPVSYKEIIYDGRYATPYVV